MTDFGNRCKAVGVHINMTPEAKIWVKVDFFWREKKSFAARGWAIRKQLPSPKIIPSNASVDDKIVIFLV
jgi:hypothetical protein